MVPVGIVLLPEVPAVAVSAEIGFLGPGSNVLRPEAPVAASAEIGVLLHVVLVIAARLLHVIVDAAAPLPAGTGTSVPVTAVVRVLAALASLHGGITTGTDTVAHPARIAREVCLLGVTRSCTNAFPL